MRKSDVANITPGLYVLHWKEGGTSLAAVGVTASGGRWMAPVNWIRPSDDPTVWRIVKKATPVRLP